MLDEGLHRRISARDGVSRRLYHSQRPNCLRLPCGGEQTKNSAVGVAN